MQTANNTAAESCKKKDGDVELFSIISGAVRIVFIPDQKRTGLWLPDSLRGLIKLLFFTQRIKEMDVRLFASYIIDVVFVAPLCFLYLVAYRTILQQ